MIDSETVPMMTFHALRGSVLGVTGGAEPPYTKVDRALLMTLLQQRVSLNDVRRPEEWRQPQVIKGSRLFTQVDARGRVNLELVSRLEAKVLRDSPHACRTDRLAREPAYACMPCKAECC